MKRNRTTLWTICCVMIFLLFAAGPAKAEVKPIDPSKIHDIKKLLDLIRLEEVVMLTAETALERFFPILKEATARNNQAVSETVFAILKGTIPSRLNQRFY